MDEQMSEKFEEWAVTILGDNPNWRESGAGELARQAWIACAAALSQPAAAPQWVLASSLLPEVEQRVLMTMDAWDGEVDIGQHLREGKFYCGDRSYFYPERTYWMPIPATPKATP